MLIVATPVCPETHWSAVLTVHFVDVEGLIALAGVDTKVTAIQFLDNPVLVPTVHPGVLLEFYSVLISEILQIHGFVTVVRGDGMVAITEIFNPPQLMGLSGKILLYQERAICAAAFSNRQGFAAGARHYRVETGRQQSGGDFTTGIADTGTGGAGRRSERCRVESHTGGGRVCFAGNSERAAIAHKISAEGAVGKSIFVAECNQGGGFHCAAFVQGADGGETLGGAGVGRR